MSNNAQVSDVLFARNSTSRIKELRKQLKALNQLIVDVLDQFVNEVDTKLPELFQGALIQTANELVRMCTEEQREAYNLLSEDFLNRFLEILDRPLDRSFIADHVNETARVIDALSKLVTSEKRIYSIALKLISGFHNIIALLDQYHISLSPSPTDPARFICSCPAEHRDTANELLNSLATFYNDIETSFQIFQQGAS